MRLCLGMTAYRGPELISCIRALLAGKLGRPGQLSFANLLAGRFACNQAVKLGADIGHATRHDHSAHMTGGLAGLDDALNA